MLQRLLGALFCLSIFVSVLPKPVLADDQPIDPPESQTAPAEADALPEQELDADDPSAEIDPDTKATPEARAATTLAAGDEEGGPVTNTPPKESVPEVEKSSGAFRYSIPFSIPAFRGLEPKLALTYSSSGMLRGRAESYAGVNWKLDGLSVIERVVVGGGMATFNDTYDIFRLDGEDLLACKTASGATAPYGQTYPAEYEANASTASCASGGQLTSQKENYLRIQKVAATLSNGAAIWNFVVTDKSGNSYVYKPLGQLVQADLPGAAPLAAADAKFHAVYSRKYLLAETRSPQKDAAGNYTNVVTYSYKLDPYNGAGTTFENLSERPWKIEYAGYRIEFGYERLSAPHSTFSVGDPVLFGRQFHLLRSVQVYDGATPIRAYAVTFETSELAGAKRLKSVQELGNDFVLANEIVTPGPSGTPLPPTVMTYSDDVPEYIRKNGASFGYTDSYRLVRPNFADLQPDGRNEIIVVGCASVSEECNSQELARTYRFDPNVALGSASIKTDPFKVVGRALDEPSLVTVVPGERSSNGLPRSYTLWSNANGTTLSRLSESGAGLSNVGLMSSSGGQPALGFWGAVELDGDPNLEFVVTRYGDNSPNVIQLDANSTTTSTAFLPSVFLGQPVNSVPANSADLNGNGLSDFIDKDRGGRFIMFGQTPASRLFSTGDQTSSKNWTGGNSSDYNGDGLDDFITKASPGLRGYWSWGYGVWPAYNGLYSGSWSLNSGCPTSIVVGDFLNTADINGDGLPDVISSAERCQDSDGFGPIRPGVVFLNTGGGSFERLNTLRPNTNADPATYLGMGDVNGDGLPEIVESGAIRYSTGLPANMLTSVSTPLGATYTVGYAPTSDGVGADPVVMDDRTPGGARMVVASLSVTDGRGQTITTDYRYVGGRYDETLRKSLGFTEVREIPPLIDGETVRPVRTTIYDTTSYLTAGNMLSDTLRSGSTILSQSVNTWTNTGTGKGPYKSLKASERSAALYGAQLIETKKTFTWTAYGEPATITDWGFTSGGTDLLASDNVTTVVGYVPNLASYIVNLPAERRSNTGTTNSTDQATWLAAEWFVYDGAASQTAAPVEGNLTQHWRWNGLPTSGHRVERIMTYDDWGNVLSETDSRGNTASYAYDPAKHLFRLTATNPLSQIETTTWNSACQAPGTVTDINGLVTSFTYDAFCRETRRDFASGQYMTTAYVNFGTPATQYIEQRQKSPSTLAGAAEKISRTYFDALGRQYKTAASGATSAEADLIVTVQGFDKRSNVAWSSNPMTWAQAVALGTTVPTVKTTFTYDSLNRLTKTTFADATFETTAYEALDPAIPGQSLIYPAITVKDAHCTDAPAQNTICGKSSKLSDARGNAAQEIRWSLLGTDVNAEPSVANRTTFTFSLRNELIAIKDPQGLKWFYSYDSFGNRTSASDPGLGAAASDPTLNALQSYAGPVGPWTMTYDNNGNLLTQTDAKGQTIAFTYDVLNRVTKKEVTAGGVKTTTTYAYDEAASGYFNNGQLTTQVVYRPGSTTSIEHRTINWYTNAGVIGRQLQTLVTTTYSMVFTYAADGVTPISQTLPSTPGATTTTSTGTITYDAAGRVVSFVNGGTTYITSVAYDLWSHPTTISYGNGAADLRTYDALRGWALSMNAYEYGGASAFVRTEWTRTATGRIKSTLTEAANAQASQAYTYDYAGRLLLAIGTQGNTGFNQAFTYDTAGRMLTNSRVGTYTYANTGKALHAPSLITPVAGASTTLTFDANGNMLTGLDGKVMEYDGENRPLSVTFNGLKTCYVYGADGSRVKKIEGLAAGTACPTGNITGSRVTAYFGGVEVRNFGAGAAFEELHIYPYADLRVTKTNADGGAVETSTSWLHRDGLSSVRGVTGTDGLMDERATYRPFGEAVSVDADPTAKNESKGWIGERFDADAGLQYLNARYYDPKLGLFLQPDWWEVTEPGVGTNRYSYAFNDPIGASDPSGHAPGDWSMSQEESDKANQELADSWYKEAQANLERMGYGDNFDPGAEWAAKLSFENATRYQERVGMPQDIRIRYDLGRLAKEFAFASLGSIRFRAPSAPTRMSSENPLLKRYLSESGGRWGNTATRTQNNAIAATWEAKGYKVQGAGRTSEEWIPGPQGGTLGGTFVDITARQAGAPTVRIQTVDVLADGITLTPREAAAIARIKTAFPNDLVVTIPKVAQ
jgi:RHS repeat-associated protein